MLCRSNITLNVFETSLQVAYNDLMCFVHDLNVCCKNLIQAFSHFWVACKWQSQIFAREMLPVCNAKSQLVGKKKFIAILTCLKSNTWSRLRRRNAQSRKLRNRLNQYHLLLTELNNVSGHALSNGTKYHWLTPSKGHYWVARKRRYCHLPSKKTNKYCGEHLTEQQKEDINQDSRIRIPCPFDPLQ